MQIFDKLQVYNQFLSSFEILEIVGTGALSHVYKIRHKITKRFYALKEVFLEREEDILSVISEKNLACQDFQHPNLLEYQSIVVSTRIEGLSKFVFEEERSTVDKDILNEYGISVVCWNRPSSSAVSGAGDLFHKFNERFLLEKENANGSFSKGFSSEAKKEMKIKRKNSVKINETNENYLLKKDVSTKFYHYLITYYSEFTLKEFIALRNEVVSKNNLYGNTLLSKMVSDSFISKKRKGSFFYDKEKGKIINNAFCKKINASFIRKILIGILEGVSHLHSRRIIHGDISPYNIFFIDCYDPKIGDYGDAFFGEKKDEYMDLKRVAIIYFELLCPFETVSEKHYAIEALYQKKYPLSFENEFKNEKIIIEELLGEKKSASEILKMI